MNKKIIMLFVFMLVGSMSLLSAGFSTLTDGNIAYWSMENTGDSSGNGNTLTEYNGVTHSTGIIDNDYLFDGSDDYLNAGNLGDDWTTISYGGWIKTSSTKNNNYPINKWGSDYSYSLRLYQGKLQCAIHTNNDYVYPISSNAINDGNWHFVYCVYDGNTIKNYIDGNEVASDSITGNIYTSNINLLIGQEERNGIYYEGDIDEVSLYDRVLSSDEILELYNNGLGYNPYKIIQTPIIQHNITSYYNSQNISIQLNTTTNTNMSYILDNGSLNLICSNCNLTTLNLTGLSEGTHSILFESKDSNGVVNTTANFTIDTIKPIIINNIQTEYNYYTINFNSSCQDDNLLYCNISLNNKNIALNSSNITISYNGNINYIINAEDKAGNEINQTGTIFINPFQYITFTEYNNSIINDYEINNITQSGVFKFKLYDYNLGNNILTFQKNGFVKTEFTLLLTNTSKINNTIKIPKASLNFEFKNIDNRNLILSNLTVELSGASYGKFSSNNGTLSINDNMLSGYYTLLITDQANKFESKEIYINFDGISTINQTIYFLNLTGTNTGYVIIKATDFDGSALTYKKVFATQLDTEQKKYIRVQEGKTSGDGTVEMKVLLEKAFYIFCVELNDGNICSDATRIKTTENGKTISLYKKTSITSISSIYNKVYLNLNQFDFNKTSKLLKTNIEIKNIEQIKGQLCEQIFKINTLNVKTNYTPDCVDLTSLSLNKNYQFESNNTYEWYAYIIEDGTTEHIPYFTRFINEKVGFWDTINIFGLKWIFLVLLGISGIASLFVVDNLLIVLFINSGIIISLWTYFSEIISPESSSFIFIVVLITTWVMKE